MNRSLHRIPGARALFVLVLALAVGAFSATQAAVVTYPVTLDGPSESPPNASPGTGTGFVSIDAVAHTMRVVVTFSGLIGTTTVSHIHGPTAVAMTGTAGVATVTPTFTGFPAGVSLGSYDHTYDTSLTTSFSASFVTANGGTAAGAEAALFAAIAAGKAYFNIHSSSFSGGEIRGFFTAALSTEQSTWGAIKALYR